MRVPPLIRSLALILGLAVLSGGQVHAEFEDDYEEKPWAEIEVQLPAPPKAEDLLAFYVSPTTDNRFLIDPASISVGSDGVIRYTLVVLTPGGTRNVTFEGMRCSTGEKRIYAFGRTNGAWSKSRANKWEPVKEAVNNRHHAALYYEYFCPDGVIARSAEEARLALRNGGHPDVRRWR